MSTVTCSKLKKWVTINVCLLFIYTNKKEPFIKLFIYTILNKNQIHL